MYDSHNQDCLTCGAPAGYYCNNAAGKALKTPHKARGGRDNARAMTKRGITGKTAAEQIEPYVAAPGEPPRYALHFGKINKVGVNPRTKYDTPIAVCAYPLTAEIFEQFKTHDLPFAQESAAYLFLLGIRPGARVFYSTTALIEAGYGIADQHIVYDAADARSFFYSTRPLDGTPHRAVVWGNRLRKMGIDVWVDADNEGILHAHEPSQVMFFNPASYEIVLSLDNPRKGMVTAPRETVVPFKALIRRGIKDFRNVVLTNEDKAELMDVDLAGANLSGLNLKHARLERANLSHADLSDARLLDANLSNANLAHANLSSADLWSAHLRKADLTRANLSGADLSGAHLTSAELEHANLSKSQLIDTDLSDANLKNAILVDARMTRAKLLDADLTGASLVGAKLEDADLSGANLRSSNLFYANLKFAVLVCADLTGADLRHATLWGTDLRGADLSGANLTDVKWYHNTLWPDGFTPPPPPRSNRSRR